MLILLLTLKEHSNVYSDVRWEMEYASLCGYPRRLLRGVRLLFVRALLSNAKE